MSWLGIQELRKATGITAKDLADKIGKDASYVSKIEKGYILNTSYDTVMSMAQVIAASEAIKSGKVDLNDYDSEFSRLVLSCRYAYMKDVYDYVKENKEVEEYSKIIRNLNNDDLNTFRAVINYRRAEKGYNQIIDEFKREILKQSKARNIKTFFKDLTNHKKEIIFQMNINAEILMEENFDDSITSILDLLEFKVEDIKQYGIESIINEMDCYGEGEDTDEEIELPKPE